MPMPRVRRFTIGAVCAGLLASLFALAGAAQLPSAKAEGPSASASATIADILVRESARTDEDTVRALAGVRIGDTIGKSTLTDIRARLLKSDLFNYVAVFWEPLSQDAGTGTTAVAARVVIVARQKWPYLPQISAHYVPGDYALRAQLAHANVGGIGKLAFVAGEVGKNAVGGSAGYRDPALFGSWAYFELAGGFSSLAIPEFGNIDTGNGDRPLRATKLTIGGGQFTFGVNWWRRVRTQVGYSLRFARATGVRDEAIVPEAAITTGETQRQGSVHATISFDGRTRDRALTMGQAWALDFSPSYEFLGGDDRIRAWRASFDYEWGRGSSVS